MERSLRVRKRLVCALWAGSLFFSWSQACFPASGLLDQARLVQQRDVIDGEFELISGPMLYQKHEDAFFSKGYRPRSTVKLTGTLRREIHDLPGSKAAYGVYRRVVEALQEAGFEPVYQCRQQACGNAEGWPLYLGPLIGGPAQAQHYYLGAAAGKASLPAPYVAIHVNELEGQARLLVDYVVPDLTGLKSRSKPLPMRSPAIFFDRSRATPAAASHAAMRSLSRRLLESAPGDVLVLHGHADTDGTLLGNIILSAHRARVLQQLLVEQHGVPPQRLVAWGLGSLIPDQTNRTEAGKAANRRVDAFRISMD
jgi:outer membrane protein OmpA-like peptidoglycan-associated protein